MVRGRVKGVLNDVGRSVSVRWVGAFGILAAAGLVALSQISRIEEALTRSARSSLSRMVGADVATTGLRVHLWPRPRVVFTDVHVQALPGVPELEAPVVEATQSLGSLVSGHVSFSELRLVAPRIVVDADARPADASRAAGTVLGHLHPGKIVIEAGTLMFRSRHDGLRGPLSDLDAVVTGLDHNGLANASGSGTWRGTRVDVSAQIEPVLDFVLGRPASGSASLRSLLLTAAVDGQFHNGIHGGFEGSVAVATPMLPELLRTARLPATLGHVADAVSFSGNGIANPDTITFSNAHFSIDGTPFEGSLAWQPNGGHWAWTGTFAADDLDLTRGVTALTSLQDDLGRWRDTPWGFDAAALGDIDLRISAAHARLGPIGLEDAAFSALCRDGRIEVGFSEARSLDGLVRGRAVAAMAGPDLDLKVDLSMTQMDVDPLARAVGATGMSGSASGHLTAEARGASPRGLAANLTGRGQLSIRDGFLPSLPSVADLSALGVDTPAWLRSRATLPFDLATATLRLADARLSFVDGRVVEAGEDRSFSAEASLDDRSFSVLTMPPRDAGTEPTTVSGVLGTPPRILKIGAARDLGAVR